MIWTQLGMERGDIDTVMSPCYMDSGVEEEVIDS